VLVQALTQQLKVPLAAQLQLLLSEVLVVGVGV
jgi:hypothetical protein